MDELLKDFLAETTEQLESIGAQLVRYERDPSDARILANAFRAVHAIKGTCGFLSLPRLERMAHATESLIEGLRGNPRPSQAHVTTLMGAIDRVKFILGEIGLGFGEPAGDDERLIADMALFDRRAGTGVQKAPQTWDLPLSGGSSAPERRADTVRISLKTLESMTALVQELTLARNQLEDAARFERSQRLREALQRLSSVAAELKLSVFAARMQPLDRLFANFHRTVRDLAAELGKKIELSIEGGGVELDRQLIEAVRDPLTHLIRNAVDHGIETPEQRAAAGKSETGLIRVVARREAADVSIVVGDDGRGLDAALIRERAVALGLGARERVDALDERDALRLVFLPSFSTAGRVSAISGRGIGLDIVRNNIEAAGGSIELDSRAGAGVEISLRVPLTMAVTPAFVLKCGGERYLLAQHHVESIEAVGAGAALESMPDALLWRVGGAAFPAVRLGSLLGMPGTSAPGEIALILRSGAERHVLIVDEIVEVQEAVFKPLPPEVPLPNLFSGAAILNDGDVVLALDPSGIAGIMGLDNAVSAKVRAVQSEVPADGDFQMLTFQAAPRLWRATPLQTVDAVQTARRADFETADGVCVIRRDGGLIPVIDLPAGAAADATRIVILREGADRIAVTAESVGDVQTGDFKIELLGQGPGVLGIANIGGAATEVLDLFQLMDLSPLRRAPLALLDARPEVLLVEPSQIAREMLARALKSWGCRVWACPDEAAAAAVLSRRRGVAVSLVALGYANPRASAVMRTLRAGSADGRAPIYGLSAAPTPAARSQALRSGLNGLLDRFDRRDIHAALAAECARLAHGEAA